MTDRWLDRIVVLALVGAFVAAVAEVVHSVFILAGG